MPTIRNLEGCLEWADVFAQNDTTFIIVQDGTGPDVSIPDMFYQSCREVKLLRWRDIDNLLGSDNWIISRKDSAIRSFGWLWAHLSKLDFDYVFTFDDDTRPVSKAHLNEHLENLRNPVKNMMFNSVPQFGFNSPFEPRGFLGPERMVYISHGLWLNVPDFGADWQQQLNGIYKWQLPEFRQTVPAGVLYPMCGMNLCFRKELAPFMYFGLMGENPEGEPWGIGRWDDMFAGWMSKLWLDRIGGAVVSGAPFCNHQRASNVESNLRKESLWRDSREIVDILGKLPALSWDIDTIRPSLFLKELMNRLLSAGFAGSNAVDHFLKCLEGAILYAGRYE